MKMYPSTTRRSRPGFTLVELLVVIGMIAVLVALGTGALFKFRGAGDKLKASNNLKELQLANISYSTDHNGKYVPIYGTNNDGVKSYWPSNKVFLSLLFSEAHAVLPNGDVNTKVPDGFFDKTYLKEAGSDSNAHKFFGGPYGYNHTTELAATGLVWGSEGSYGGARVTRINDPVRTMAFGLCSNWILRYESRLNYLENPDDGINESGMLRYFYSGKVPVVFYDGHVEFLSPQDIRKFDSNGGEDHPFWNGTVGS